MNTIYKYPLEVTDTQGVMMSRQAKILSVQSQEGQLCLWALTDPEQPKVPRQIWIFGTGHPIKLADDLIFIGTVQQAGGKLVWHVFEQP